jgi:hypothetical protein
MGLVQGAREQRMIGRQLKGACTQEQRCHQDRAGEISKIAGGPQQHRLFQLVRLSAEDTVRYILLLVNSSVFVKTMIVRPTPKNPAAITLPNEMSLRFCVNTQNTKPTRVKTIPAPTDRSR